MENKKVKPNVTTTALKTEIYFCPVCTKGHIIYKGQERCDKCGTEIDWYNVKGDEEE